MQDIANTPKAIMRIAVPDGSIMRERDVKAQALPMARGIEWLSRARTIESKLLSVAPDAIAAAMAEVVECICDYDETWPHDAIRKNASAVQITNALSMLMEMNDPLAAARAKKEQETERGLRMLERLGGTADLKPLIEKHISAASAASPNGSASTL